jgi:hypothetical protein
LVKNAIKLVVLEVILEELVSLSLFPIGKEEDEMDGDEEEGEEEMREGTDSTSGNEVIFSRLELSLIFLSSRSGSAESTINI